MSDEISDAGHAPRSLIAAYALSGACALVFQVVWYHALVDRLGASATTFLVVLCAFIGGLGLGAVLSERAYQRFESRWGGHGLKNYGRTELAITAAVLLLFVFTEIPAGRLLGTHPYTIRVVDGLTLSMPTLTYQALKIGMASAAVFLPCVLMGLTFPYLCSLYPKDTRLPSRLYASNTLGACLAVVLTQFWGVRVLGYHGCLGIAAIGTLALGLIFVRRPERPTIPRSSSRGGRPPADHRLSLAPAMLAGLLCGGWQALSYVLVKLVLGPTRGVFALLAFFSILGIWLASSTVHHRRPSRTALLVAAWIGLVWCIALWWLEPGFSERLVASGSVGVLSILPPYLAALVTAALSVGAMIFVPYTMWSTLLPHLCDRQQAAGVHLARTYGLNTLSFLAGVLVFGWALQHVNVFYAWRVFVAAAAIGLLVLTLSSWSRPLPRKRLTAALVTLAATAMALPFDLDLRLMAGLFPAERRAEDYISSPQHLFWVRPPDSEGSRALMFDRHSMSGDGTAAQIYMRTMAHVPLLLHDDPRRVLLICFGVGLTADAIRTHGVEEVDVVDLNSAVYRLNRHFGRRNNRVLEDPRLRLICDDGRQYLKLSGGSYDLVTLEPPPPLQPGISRLYSAEFYAEALKRLADGGMVSQWLPESQMDQTGVDLIVGTFVQAFPHTLLVAGSRRDLVLVGSNAPIDLRRIEESLEVRRRVRTDLARVGLDRSDRLLATVMQTDADLRVRWGSGPVIRDGFMSLEGLQVSPVQQLHRDRPFAVAKAGLQVDTESVARALEAAGSAHVAAVTELQQPGNGDPVMNLVLPPIYRR